MVIETPCVIKLLIRGSSEMDEEKHIEQTILEQRQIGEPLNDWRRTENDKINFVLQILNSIIYNIFTW